MIAFNLIILAQAENLKRMGAKVKGSILSQKLSESLKGRFEPE